jgi:translocation and assembly module TamB
MTHSPNSEPESSNKGQRLRLILLSRPFIGGSVLLLIALVGAGWWLWGWVYRNLSPLVEQNLTKTLDRPVKLGPVERLTPAGLRFGASAIPPVTRQLEGQTIRDADAATVKAVEVGFDPIALVFRRTLNLDVTLIQPELYLDQTKDGAWITTTITPAKEPGPIQIALKTVQVREATAVVVPYKTSPQRLQNLNGTATLGQQVRFDGRGQLATGGNFTTQGEWSQTQGLTLAAQASNLVLQPLTSLLPQPLFQIKAGQANADLKLRYVPNQPFQVTGEAQLQSITAVVPDRYLLQSSRPRPRVFQNLNGTLRFLGTPDQQIGFNVATQVPEGGQIWVNGNGSLTNVQADFKLQARNLAATILDGAFKLPIAINGGRTNADLAIKITPQQQPSLQGTAQLQNIAGRIAELPQPFQKANGQLQIKGLDVTLNQIQAEYGQIPLQASGSIGPQKGYNLTTTTAPVAIAAALDTLEVANLPFPVSGMVQVPNIRVTGPIQAPILTGSVTTLDTPVIDKVPFDSLTAQFRLAAPALQVTNIRAVPQAGGLVTGQAQLDVRPGGELVADLQTATPLPGNAIAQNYGTPSTTQIGPVTATVSVSGPTEDLRTLVAFQAPKAIYATTGNVVVRGGKTTLQDVVAQVAGGTITVNGETIKQKDWKATATATGINLNQFVQTQPGNLSARLNFTGSLATFTPDTIRAQGQVRFSQGLALIQEPMTAQVRWNGDNIIIPEATAPGFRANGLIAVDTQASQAPQVTGINLNVQARNYALAKLLPLGPTGITLSGAADLTGRITGSLTDLNFNSSLQLKKLGLPQLAFEPTLTGSLNYTTKQGLNLQLAGQRDRIEAVTNPNFQPESFYVKRDETIAQGTVQGDTLQGSLQQFPLQALNLRPAAEAGLGPVAGIASGNFSYDFSTQAAAGTVAIARPAIGYISADQFTGAIAFADDVATLKNGELRRGNSQFLINAQAQIGKTPEFSGQVQIARAEVQDILQTLQIFELSDLGRGLKPLELGTAADVQIPSLGIPDASLSEQLSYFAKIQDQVAQQKVASNQPIAGTGVTLPPLEELQGSFNGQINVANTAKTGLNATFNLQGQNFQWGDYRVGEIVGNGTFANDTVALQPLRMSTDSSSAVLTGQLGGERQSGKLVLTNVSLAPLNQIVALPFNVAGQVNGTATLSGSLTDPQAQGQFNLANGALDQTPIQQAEATFAYDASRLNLQSSATLQGSPEPLRLAASLPYQAPTATQEPTSDQISVNINVRDQGLSLLNLFTDQVTWVNGQGSVDLRAQGTLKQPELDGTIALQNATFRAQALPDPLTGVTGTVQLNRDSLTVDKLTGQYGQGQVVAVGLLPIFESIAQPNPLTISLNNLSVELQNLYKGGVGGNIVITGSAFNPEIGGTVALRDGQVLLTQGQSESETAAANDEAAPAPASGGTAPSPSPAQSTAASTTPTFTPTLNNLQVSLGDNLQVSRPPVLRIVAAGDLTLNGPLETLEPKGKIEFQRGDVNLLLTRFRVDSRRPNFAEFTPKEGIANPLLDLNLIARVAEVTSARTTSLSDFEEVPPSSLGAFETVRVRAEVDGRVNQLLSDPANAVTLSSIPSRSQGEIFALLGGGFTGQLKEGETTGALTTLASSAFLNSLQGTIDQVLGSRVNLSLYPLVIPSSERNSSVLSLGGELGFDLTNRLTVSASQVLTGQDTPTRFNVIYQLSDRVQARTAVSNEGEGVGVLEYRANF